MEENICVDGFDSTLIPVEILSCDIARGSRSQDALSIVELGKQLLLSAKNGDKESVRDLMCRGAPFTTDWLGTSALHLAAQNNHIETAEILLRAGISRDARTKVDRTPLHMAAYEGHFEMVQLLLNYGADTDSRDMLRMTPLHWAVENEHIEVIRILLEHGADVYAASKFDKTPINLAIEHQRFDIVDMLNQDREAYPKSSGLQSQSNVSSQSQDPDIEIGEEGLIQLEANRQEQIHLEHRPQKKKVQASAGKKQRMLFQQIQVASDDEQEKELGKIDGFVNTAYMSNKNHKNLSDFGVNQPFQLLQAHGITMIPVENDSIVENAMESGRTVVLTEAGKLALNLTKTNVKRIQVQNTKKVTPRKVITIRANQILGQSASPVTSTRSPNILKKNTDKNKTIITAIPNVQNFGSITISPLTKAKTITKAPEMILHLDDEIEEITEEENNHQNSTPDVIEETDVAILSRELAKARKLAEEYRKALQKKAEEAESYKQQLRTLFAQRAAK